MSQSYRSEDSGLSFPRQAATASGNLLLGVLNPLDKYVLSPLFGVLELIMALPLILGYYLIVVPVRFFLERVLKLSKPVLASFARVGKAILVGIVVAFQLFLSW